VSVTMDDQGAMSRYRRLSRVPGFVDRKPERWAGTAQWSNGPARLDADGMDVRSAAAGAFSSRSASPMPWLS